MQIKLLVSAAAIALVAGHGAAVAGKEPQGLTMLSGVSADRLSLREMDAIRGAATLHIHISGVSIHKDREITFVATLNMCGNAPGCAIEGFGRPVPD